MEMKWKNKIFQYYIYPGGCWFRVCGYGISINDMRIHPPLFSERQGHRKALRIGHFSIKLLKKD